MTLDMMSDLATDVLHRGTSLLEDLPLLLDLNKTTCNPHDTVSEDHPIHQFSQVVNITYPYTAISRKHYIM